MDCTSGSTSHVMRLQPELVEMTINGVSVDERLQSKFADELGRSLEDARAVCQVKARASTGIPDYEL